MKGYKAFDMTLKNELVCRNIIYNVNELHRHDGKVILCSDGFHWCEKLDDVFSYYPLDSVVCEIEASGLITATSSGCSKRASSEIQILKILSHIEILNILDSKEAVNHIVCNNIKCVDLVKINSKKLYNILTWFTHIYKINFLKDCILYLDEIPFAAILASEDNSLDILMANIDKINKLESKLAYAYMTRDFEKLDDLLSKCHEKNESLDMILSLIGCLYIISNRINDSNQWICDYITASDAVTQLLLDLTHYRLLTPYIVKDETAMMRVIVNNSVKFSPELLNDYISNIKLPNNIYSILNRFSSEISFDTVVEKLLLIKDKEILINILNHQRISDKIKKYIINTYQIISVDLILSRGNKFYKKRYLDMIYDLNDIGHLYENNYSSCITHFNKRITEEKDFCSIMNFENWKKPFQMSNITKLLRDTIHMPFWDVVLDYIKINHTEMYNFFLRYNIHILLGTRFENHLLNCNVIEICELITIVENIMMKGSDLLQLISNITKSSINIGSMDNIIFLKNKLIEYGMEEKIAIDKLNDLVKNTNLNLIFTTEYTFYREHNRNFVSIDAVKSWISIFPMDISFFQDKGFI